MSYESSEVSSSSSSIPADQKYENDLKRLLRYGTKHHPQITAKYSARIVGNIIQEGNPDGVRRITIWQYYLTIQIQIPANRYPQGGQRIYMN